MAPCCHNSRRSLAAPGILVVSALLALPGFLQAQAASADGDSSSSLSIVLTADTCGSPRPCDACEEGTAAVELSRRLSLVRSIRGSELPVLLLDAGNAFFGREESRATRNPAIVAYEALDYDAVNISYRDLRRGKEALERIVAEAAFPVISASVLDAESGEPIGRPWVVVEEGGLRAGVIGVTGLPPGVEHLDHLEGQLEGVRIVPPVEALESHLPDLRRETETVIVLYYGTAAEAGRIRKRFGDRIAALLVGGVDSALLPMAGFPPLAGAAGGGSELAVGAIDPRKAGGLFRTLPVSEAVPPDGELRARLESLLPASAQSARTPLAAAEPRRIPASAPLGEPLDVHVHGRNRGLGLSVRGARLSPAPDAGLFLELDTVWENRLPLDLIYGLDYGEGGKVGDVTRQLFLLVDGSRVARVLEADGDGEELLPKSFQLPEPGAVREGKVTFPIRGAGDPPFQTLELRFYSQSFAPIIVRLTEATNAPGSDSPALEEAKAPMARLSLHGAQATDEIHGQTSPEGMEWIVADLRGQSLIEREVDARALDAEAPDDAKAPLGIVYEYLESRETLQLLVDDSYAYRPRWELGSLPEDPPFFPDVAAGGELVFLVPEGAARIELCCFFPETRLTTGESFGVPEPACFTIRDGEPLPEEGAPLEEFPDRPVPVEVRGFEFAERFMGERSPSGKRWVIVDLSVENVGEEPGLYEVEKRFRLEADGKAAPPHPASSLGPRAPPDPLWLPAGARRSFQLVFEVPADAGTARLVHGGIKRQSSVALPLAKAAGDAAASPAMARGPSDSPGTEQSSPALSGDSPSPEEASSTSPSASAVAALLAPDKEPEGLEGVGVTAREVNEAIDRGRAFLWHYILEEKLEGKLEDFPNSKAQTIAALALVHSGAAREFPDFNLVLRGWLGGEQADVEPPPNAARHAYYASGRTYAGSVFCMTIDSYDDPLFFPYLRAMAQCLVDGQYEGGSWDYTIPRLELGVVNATGSGPLLVLGGEPRGERIARNTPYEPGNGDNSTSQFALLGLRSAVRRGFLPPEETWKRAQLLYETRQGDDGGWAYRTGSSYGSMSCAGACSVLLARWALGEEQPAAYGPVLEGLRWLADEFTVTTNPHKRLHHFYYLYSLERVGRLFDTEFLGENEWYPIGVRQILRMQLADGGWKERKQRIAPTAFALLFLTRATEKLVEEEREGPGTLRVVSKPVPESQLYFILDASGSMQSRMGERTKFEVARDAIEALVEELPESQRVALRVYGHRYNALQEEAATDTELEVPMRPWTDDHRGEFLAKIRSLRPRGKTPLAFSIEKAAGDLPRMRGHGRTTVVLLTDGGEDATSPRDPVEAAGSLERLRDVELVVIGFDIGNASWTEQLQGIAEAGRGTYWPADRPGTLTTALHAAARRPPEDYGIFDTGGSQVARLSLGEGCPLEPGSYVVQTTFGAERLRQEVRIRPGRPTTVVVDPSALQPGSGGGVATNEATTDRDDAPADMTSQPEKPTPKTVRFCTQCGARAKPGANFCTQCGNKLRS